MSRWSRCTTIVLAVYWTAIFIGTHRPPEDEPFPVDVSDKTLHYAAYAGLTFLMAAWFSARQALTVRRLLPIIFAAWLYGALDELTQIPVGRTCDVFDWVADAVGALTGLGMFLAAHWLIRQTGVARETEFAGK